MKMKLTSLVAFILAITLVACSQTKVQNENLPAGMKSGYWANNETKGYVFFENGYFVDSGGEKFGSYSLAGENTIELQSLGRTEHLDITVSESGERIVISRSGKDDDIFTLIVSDTNSDNLEKNIIGEWKSYGDLSFINDEDDFFVEFKRNGNIIFSDSEGRSETSTYEFIGDKIVIETNDGVLLYSGFSLGDLIYLADLDKYTNDLDGFMWIFLVRK
jgi:hypothetical protein